MLNSSVFVTSDFGQDNVVDKFYHLDGSFGVALDQCFVCFPLNVVYNLVDPFMLVSHALHQHSGSVVMPYRLWEIPCDGSF